MAKNYLDKIISEMNEEGFQVSVKEDIKKDNLRIEILVYDILQDSSANAISKAYNIVAQSTSTIGSISPKYDAENNTLNILYTTKYDNSSKQEEAKKVPGCGKSFGYKPIS